MIAGSCISTFAIFLLGFTRWFASIFTGWDNESNDILTIWLAVVAIYLIDFSVNAVMAVDRALIVDTVPPSAQPQATAWAARMVAIGAVLGFFFGNVNLRNALPFFGKTQLQILCVVASLVLLGGHFTMATLVKERVLVPNAHGQSNKKSLAQEMKNIWRTLLTLPRLIRQICVIQFFAWLGWFPLLFYATIYIGDLHKRNFPIPSTEEAQAALDTEATQLGSRALFWSSILSLIGNIVLPAFVAETAINETPKPPTRFGYGRSHEHWWTRLTTIPSSLRVHIASLYAFSHLVFAACMFATLFTDSVAGASLMITITGFPWAVAMWAPFSMLATAILTESTAEDDNGIRLADTRTRQRRPNSSDLDVNADERNVFLPGDASDSEDEHPDGNFKATERIDDRLSVMGNAGAQLSRLDISGTGRGEGYQGLNGSANGGVEEAPSGDLSGKAGVILGIQNISVVIPQFLVTGIASLVFAIFDPQTNGLPPHHGAPVHGPDRKSVV